MGGKHTMKLLAAIAAATLIFTLRAAPEAKTVAPFPHGPYVQNVKTGSAVIQWRTGKKTVGSVKYGLEGQTLDRERKSPSGENHEVLLDGLTSDSVYRYEVYVDGAKKDGGQFRTATTGGRFKFIVYGDNRSQREVHEKVAAAIAREAPDFIINTGDLVGSGALPAHWDEFFDIERALLRNVPLYPSLGNHEQDAKYYFDFFNVPGGVKNVERYYAFRWGGGLFLSLDSNMPHVMDAKQKKFIKDVFLDHKDALWRFAFFHHPPVTTLARGGELPLQYFVPYLEKGRTDIVFNGHNHFYERIENGRVQYVTTGGGGAPLYDFKSKPNMGTLKKQKKDYHYVRVTVDGPALLMEAVDLSGSVFDRVELRK